MDDEDVRTTCPDATEDEEQDAPSRAKSAGMAGTAASKKVCVILIGSFLRSAPTHFA
jgi:hypothetical protein